MLLTGHALDHLPDDIVNTRPPTALWEFVTEQSMGEVTCSVTSHMYPFAQLANCNNLCRFSLIFPDLL